MWPFPRKRKPILIPALRGDDFHAVWDSSFQQWEFSFGKYHYSLSENPVFDLAILSKLPQVENWVADLANEIDEKVRQHLEGWCDWHGEKDLISIDVFHLLAKEEVDVAYAHEDWADLGINIVITAGKITDSYAGD